MDKSNTKAEINIDEKTKHSASEILDTLKNKAYNLQEKAIHFQEEAKSLAKEKYNKVCDSSSELGDKVITYTKDNPVKAIAIAAIAGAVITKIFSSRK
jgi:ElaB/YqjD/DUF883 family membrane-anchored ribosome-binding protein